MANIIYGINAGNGLTELPSKLKALETLGLKADDLNTIGNTDNKSGAARTNLASKINTNQFHHLSMGSGSPMSSVQQRGSQPGAVQQASQSILDARNPRGA